MMKLRSTSGFTLIEMLVVLAITMLLMGLIFAPIISSFNLTHRAQVMTEAQDTARQTLEMIQRELSQAMFVYDNTNSPVTVYLTPDPTNLSTPRGTPYQLQNAKVDFVLPKLMMHCNAASHPANQPRDYERGDEAWPSCPHDGSNEVEARPIQPLRQDTKIVRYFIGLKNNDPEWPYMNTYTMKNLPGVFGSANWEVVDNPYVLYRVEFSLGGQEDPIEIDSNDLFPSSMTRAMDRLNWPDFFYSEEQGANGEPIWKNWKKIAQVVGPADDVDMIEVVSGVPKPAVRFAPTGMDNDTLTATYLSDKSAETPSSVPTVFRATHGHWGPNFKVMVYNSDYSDWYYTDWDGTDLWIYNKGGMQVFNITAYQDSKLINPNAPTLEGPLDMMFDVDLNKGEVTFAFASSHTVDAQDVEDAFAQQYQDNINNSGIGMGERTAVIGGALTNIPNAKMIPGTEQVVGPDMAPGPNRGNRMVRYDRVPLAVSDPGLNQYKIDYDYTPAPGETNTTSAKIWFTSDPNTMLPAGSIEISYQYHNNGPDQIVKADYDTKNLFSVSLAIRLYDSASGKPMVVELSDQIQVRNIAR